MVDVVSGVMAHQKTNIREAAITVLLNYSITFLQKDDSEGKVQAISALAQVA